MIEPIHYSMMFLCLVNMTGVIYFLYNSRGLSGRTMASHIFQMHKILIRAIGFIEGLYFLSYIITRLMNITDEIHTDDFIHIIAEFAKSIFFSITIYFTIAWLRVKKRKDGSEEEWNKCFLNS